MIRLVTFGVTWCIGMMGGTLIALSDSDWAERFAAYCGDDPGAGGRAVRFFVMCFGMFIVPILHIAIWEILTHVR